MAKMYPPLENAAIDDHIAVRSEAYVYRKLAEMDDAFHVYHSIRYLDFSPRSGKPEGECDFVLLHRQLGLLILEVKGGRITCENGRWYTSGRRGKWEIKPYEQARTNEHVIVDTKLKERGVHERFPYGYAVCFPNSEIPTGSSSLQDSTLESKDVTLGGSDLRDVEAAVRGVMGKWRGSRPLATMSQQTFDAIHRVLERRFDLASSLRSELDAAAHHLIALDEMQVRFLNLMSQQTKAAFEGPAGSGKTVLATEKARRVAEDGGRVLLLTYNVPLADKLADDLQSMGDITVSNVHRWGLGLIRKTRVSDRVPAVRDGGELNDRFFSEDFPNLLSDAIGISRDRFDALIIDEGQDFDANTLTALQFVVKEGGCFYVFYDPNQDVYGTHQALGLPSPPYPLPDNYRSPRAIVDFVRERTQVPVKPHQRSIQGTRPRVVNKDGSGFRSALKEYIEDMTGLGVSPGEICLMVQHVGRFLEWWGEPALGRYEMVTDELSTRDAIRVVSVKRFKGLECEVVALCEIAGVSDILKEKKEYYVALTRAKFAARVFRVR